MSLRRFLLAFADWHFRWLGLRQWRPDPIRPLPWTWILALFLEIEVLAILAGGLGTRLLSGTAMEGSWWPLRWMLVLGTVIGAFTGALLTVAWNRRADRLQAAGNTPPHPSPPLSWWQRWLLGPVYFLGLFLATPAVLCLAIDNALGTHAWNFTRKELVQRGEPLTLKALRPPPPPDDQNFLATPLLRPLFEYRFVVTNEQTEILWPDLAGLRRSQAIGLPRPISAADSPRGPKAPVDGQVDLDAQARGIRAQPLRKVEGPLPKALAERYGVVFTNPPAMTGERAEAIVIAQPATEVLEYLRRFEPELSEITGAARRPFSVFPNETDGTTALDMVPYLSALAALKNYSNLLRVRAAARLAAGDVDGAFTDTLTAFRLADDLATEPLLIGLLVRIAQTAIAADTAWQGLASHQWSDPQLAELQTQFAGFNLRDSLILAFRGERVFANAMYEDLLSGRVLSGAEGETLIPASGPTRFLLSTGLAPIGMFRRNQVNHNRAIDIVIAQIQSPEWPSSLTSAGDTDALLRRLGLKPVTPHTILPSMALPAVEKVQGKAARINVVGRLGEIACALERHHLKTGAYPERLDELVPTFLAAIPLDPMNRQPPRYQRSDDGWYRLWSVGLNGRDDGGTMRRGIDVDKDGDWVWPIPVPSTDLRLF